MTATFADLHTPGPWTAVVANRNDNCVDCRIEQQNGGEIGVVCRFSPDDIERTANAKLIAAAPDMLAALNAIADESAFSQDANTSERINAIALAAIARAEGRQ